MSITGLEKIAIINPANKEVAQFNKVRGEGQFNVTPIDADPDSTGGIPYAGDASELEAVVYDLGAAEAKVLEWRKNNTPVMACGLGLQVNFYWYEHSRCRIQRPTQFTAGQRKRSTITMQKEGGIHDNDSVVNLLLNRPWETEGPSWVKKLLFPIEGARLTLSQDTGQAMAIRALDADDVELEAVIGADSGGRTIAEITLPAGTYYVVCELAAENAEAALRSDGQTEYIEE